MPNHTYRVTAPLGITLGPGTEVVCTAKQWDRIRPFTTGQQKRATLTAPVMFKRGEVVTLVEAIPKDMVAAGTERLDPLSYRDIQVMDRAPAPAVDEETADGEAA